MTRRGGQAGFSLLETMVAMVLVAFAMTGLVLAFVGSGKFGILSRRQANAVALARTIAGELNRAVYTDARLANNNVNNDATFADPAGLFAHGSLPTGNDAPDYAYPSTDPVHPSGLYQVGNEQYFVFINVAPFMDPADNTIEIGRQFAVIVRYQVGDRANTNEGTFMRAVVLGYRYNYTNANMGLGWLPI